MTRAIIILVLLAGLGSAAGVLVRQHDARVIAQVAARDAAVNLATERADNARLLAALTERDAEAEAETRENASLKDVITNAPPSRFSCIRSPAGRALLGRLRSNPGGN